MIVSSYYKLINKFNKDRFLKNTLISFLGVFTITILNYSYHPIISKLVSVIEYGEIQTILTLLFIVSILTTMIRMLIVNVVTNRGEDNADLAKTLSPILTLALFITIPIILLSIIGSKHIQIYFYLESPFTIILFAIYLTISIPYTFYNSYLQGHDDHKNVSLSNIIISLVKLIATLLMLYLGFGVNGAILALALSMMAGFLYSAFRVNNIKFVYSGINEAVMYLKREYNYIVDVFLSMGFITVIYSVDMLIIKRMFEPALAGGYGGIATIGKIIFFLTAFISPVISSSVKISRSHKDNLVVLTKSFKILTGLSLPLLLIIILYKKDLISALLSASYLEYDYLLIPMSILSVSLSILYIYISYLLALRHRALRHISLAGVILLSFGVNIFNDTMLSIIYVFIITSAILNMLSFYFIKYSK